MFHVPEKARVTTGPLKSVSEFGNNGVFKMLYHDYQKNKDIALWVVASDGQQWEHVSVSTPNRCPTWEEMCAIKKQFWDAEDCIVQFHPPESEYVNNHPFTLHMWRPIGEQIKTPPSILVGIK